MKYLMKYALVVVALLGFTAYNSLFYVKEWERAIRFRFGDIQQDYDTPGLHMKWMFIENIKTLDGRVQTLQTQSERYLTMEKKNLIVDTFAKWRIDDVRVFYKTVQGNVNAANQRLDQIIKDSLRSEFGKKTLQEVVGGFNKDQNQTLRAEIQDTITALAIREGKKLGLEVIDVRMKRVELPSEVSSEVFARMRTERQRVAQEFRSRGEAAAIEIRSQAERKRTVLLAEAYRDAEKMRGEGDAKAAEIYALAYGQDSDFYSFHRSLQAYRNTLKDKNDVLLLSPNTPFFEHFKLGNKQQ